MSILVNRSTRVLVQGITGQEGEFHTRRMLEYGTEVVGGVTPKKGGQSVAGVPVYNTVREAQAATGANASVVYVPAAFAPDAIMEAADAGLSLVICITEGIPSLDMIRLYHWLRQTETRLLGPNCAGVISPGESKLGIMPGHIHTKGNVGIVSRSGTLYYEVAWELTQRGIGQSTCLSIGGDPIVGTSFVDALRLFEVDPETKVIVLLGEIGGTGEEEAAEFIQDHVTKPVVAFIAGRTAPEGKRMGHAGAIVSGGRGTAAEKVAALEASRVQVAQTPSEVRTRVAQLIGE